MGISEFNQKRLNKKLGRAIDKGNLKEMGLAISLGADVNARYASWGGGDTPRPMLIHALYRDQKEAALFLLDSERSQKVDLTQTTSHQMYTPLLYAVGYFSDAEVISELIKKGSDIRAVNTSEETALHIAAEKGKLIPLTLLLDAGADINVRDRQGRTPLHHACENGHYSIVESLLLRGAKTDIANNKGNYAADIIHVNSPGIARLFTPEVKNYTIENKSDIETGWKLTAPDEVAHQEDKTAIGYRITGIFNFNARSYTQIVQNIKTGVESQSLRFFDEFTDRKMLEDAYAALLREGGSADESAIGGLRMIKNPIQRP